MSSRRHFIKGALGLAAGCLASRSVWANVPAGGFAGTWFDVSLAQWSLNKAFFSGSKDRMRFAQIAKNEFGVNAVEYVNQFYADGFSAKVVEELGRVSRGEGVTNVLIMCDKEGQVGARDEAERTRTVENHRKWIEAARALGCRAIRVNAGSAGTFDEQLKLAADGLRRLAELGDSYGVNVLVENHGGLSSNGAWLAALLRLVAHPRCGTLPDFGNFVLDRATGEAYDRYLGTQQLMPFAMGVSAKTYDFTPTGDETRIDYGRMMQIVKDAGYRGYVGIEYEGSALDEPTGILKTKQLLVRHGGRA